MIIKEIKKKYNPETKRRERYLGDRDFHSLQEIKDYCIYKTPYNEIPDDILYKFMIVDTQEEVDISVRFFMAEDGDRCVQFRYWF